MTKFCANSEKSNTTRESTQSFEKITKGSIMPNFERLEKRLETYPWGVHKNAQSTKLIINKTQKQIGKIKNASNDYEKYLLEKKLINLCGACVAYCVTTDTSEDLKNIFSKYLSKMSPKDFCQIEFHQTLKYVLKFYRKDSLPSAESRKAIKKINSLIKSINSCTCEIEKLSKLAELKSKCSYFIIQHPNRNLTPLLQAAYDFEPKRKELDLQISEKPKNSVVVYIWEPKTTLVYGSVGHVAIKINGRYISLYPETEISSIKEITQPITADFHTKERDESSEGRPADHVIEFKNLDTAAMIKAYKILKHVVQWQGTACGKESCQPLTQRNCSSMVATLLVVGRIRELFPENERNEIFPTIPSIEELNKELEQLKIEKRKKITSEKKLKVETVDIIGSAGYVGVQFYKIFDALKLRQLTLPNNFLVQVKKASELEAQRYGNSLLKLPDETKEKKQRIEKEIETITSKNLKEVFQEYKHKLLSLGHQLHSIDKRFKHFVEMKLLGDISSRNFFAAYGEKTFMQIYRKLKIQYKNLINRCLCEEDKDYKKLLLDNKDFLLTIEPTLRENYAKDIMLINQKCVTEIPKILHEKLILEEEPKAISLEKLRKEKEREKKQKKSKKVPSVVAETAREYQKILKGDDRSTIIGVQSPKRFSYGSLETSRHHRHTISFSPQKPVTETQPRKQGSSSENEREAQNSSPPKRLSMVAMLKDQFEEGSQTETTKSFRKSVSPSDGPKNNNKVMNTELLHSPLFLRSQSELSLTKKPSQPKKNGMTSPPSPLKKGRTGSKQSLLPQTPAKYPENRNFNPEQKSPPNRTSSFIHPKFERT